ncbi:MAG: LysM peptidoglycan-binding domain-containing protein [Syntrophales bacterium]
MVNWHSPICRLVILCLVMALIPSQLLFAKGSTAVLTFQKVAVPKEKTKNYVVKKGDWLVNIIRKQLDLEGIDAFRAVKLLEQLNPHIRNLSRIYPGQVLTLPGTDQQEEVGDSKADISSTEENTGEISSTEENTAEISSTKVRTGEISTAKEKNTGEKLALALPLENVLAVIRHVVTQMNGTIMTTGNYCIPLPLIGQATIDCSQIPVVELDDGTVILLDFSNRVPNLISKTIQASWKNHHLIKTTSRDDISHILQQMINVSKSYTMDKMLQPFIMVESHQIHFLFDWMITKNTLQRKNDKPYLQGISFVTDKAYLLPKSLITYAEKEGLIITEVIDGRFVDIRPDVVYTIPEIPIISKNNNSDLIGNLLTILGYIPDRNANIKIFDIAKDGFDLSLKADLVVKNGDKRLVIHSEKIPPQFTDILRNQGTEIICIGKEEPKRSAIEKTLHNMGIIFTYKNFSFSIPDNTEKAKANIIYPAIKITPKDGGDLYLIDFDMDRDIYGLLHDKWGVKIIKY